MEFRSDLAGQPLDIAAPFDGVVFRRFRGTGDYAAMARLLMATSRADGGYRYETAERVAVGYANLHNCDPYEDMIFAEVDGVVVAYSRVFWENQLDGTRAYGAFGWLDPEFRTRGIGTAMYEANEARVRSIAAAHPADIPKKVMTYSAATDVSGLRLCEKHGFVPDMYLADMVRPNLDDIPQAPMPEGLVVRTPTPDEYRKVWEADVEAFRDHQGASEPQESWYDEFLADPNFDPSLWRIAWDGDEVAGGVRSFIDKEQNEEFGRLRGWTEDISTRREYRQRGLARSLLCQSLEAVRDAGMEEAALSVHTDNPTGAYRLYESVGFVIERRDVFYTKEM
jgi:ribosomal protein S18 acetylase RimI-like enzyme